MARHRHPTERLKEYALRLRELLETKDELVKARLGLSTSTDDGVEGKLALLDQKIAGIEAKVAQLTVADS